MKLSKDTTNALLQVGMVYAEKYSELAAAISRATVASKAVQEESKEKRKTVWGLFQQAIAVAVEADHTAAAMRLGLEIACTQAEVPAGTFRGYIGTVEALRKDVAKEADEVGAITLAEALKLSVADARKRYKVETDEEKLHAKLKEAVKNWDAEKLAALVAYVGEINEMIAASKGEDEATADSADVEQDTDEARTGTEG